MSYLIDDIAPYAQTLDNDAYQLAQLRHYSLKARIIVQIKEIFAPLMTISINSVIHLIGKVVILGSNLQHVWYREIIN